MAKDHGTGATAASDEDGHVFSGYAGRLLLVMAVGTTTSMTGRLVLSPMLPTIIEDLGISPAEAGMALSVLWALTALSQFPGGRIADQWSRKTVLIGSLLCLIGGSTILLLSPSYSAFVAGVALFGTGAGLFPAAVFAQLTDLYTANRGQAFGVVSASNNLGGVLGSGLATVVLTVAIWRVAYIPIIFVFGLVVVILHRLNREPYVIDPSGVDLELVGTGRRVIGLSRVRFMIIAAALYAVTWQGTASFLPTFLQIDKGFSPTLASNAFAGLFIVGMLANPVAGGLGDRFEYPHVALGSAVLGAVGLSVIVIAEGIVLSVAGIVIFAIGLAAFWPVMNAYVMAAFPDESAGGDFGAVRTIFIVIGSLGPTYVGVVAERLTYTAAFSGLVACLCGAIAITSFLAWNH
ncbi:MAG: sugar MFS transporter [Halobacteriales archaeon]